MNRFKRLYDAISGKVPDRVPFLPKIWIDFACRINKTELQDIFNDPLAILDELAKAYIEVGADGFRQFHFPQRKTIKKDGNIFEVDFENKIVGLIDFNGGLITHLGNPEFFNYQDPWFMAYNHYYSCNRPLIPDINAAAKMTVPSKDYYKEIGCETRQKRIIKKYGNEYAIIGDCDSGTLAFLVTMRGMEQAMMDLIIEPELAHCIIQKGVAYAIEKGKFNIDMGIKILRLNDSVGNMNLISPELWEEFVFPNIKTICDELHSYDPSVRIYCHICGNVLPVLEKLADTGLDCIGPLDPLGGINPLEARNIVGNKVALLGGVNTLSFINKHVVSISEEARYCIESAGQNGGYILSSGCVLPKDSKIENITALKEVALKFGTYRNGELIKTS